MTYKFAVGQSVEFKPTRDKVGVFKVLRHMPDEFHAVDRKYRIKSEHESFERIVLECDLSASSMADYEYEAVPSLSPR
jgi:hypothetical protein